MSYKTMNNFHVTRAAMEQHKCQLDNLCRLCGCKPSKRRKQAAMAKKRPSYMFMCAEFHEELLSAFHIDTQKDSPEIHPPKFCNKCYVMMKRATVASQSQTPYTCPLEPYDWSNHTVSTCKVVCKKKKKKKNFHNSFFFHHRVVTGICHFT